MHNRHTSTRETQMAYDNSTWHVINTGYTNSTTEIFHTTGSEAYSFTTDGYGIFNVRRNVGACTLKRVIGESECYLGGSNTFCFTLI